VLQDGLIRAECPAAGLGSQESPLVCNIVFDIEYPDETVNYIYVAYTPDVLIAFNQSADRWMSLDDTVIEGRGPLTAAAGLETQDFSRLAPGQCVVFGFDNRAQPPEPCNVAARTIVIPAQAFWRSRFRIISRDRIARVCDAAADGFLTVCVMPR
jgi:hypothetical protein